MSGGFAQELKIITRAYNEAQQGLQATSRDLTGVSKAADQATSSAEKLNAAFSQATQQMAGYRQTASGLIVPLSAISEAENRAGQQAQKMGQAMEESGKHVHQHQQETKHAHDAVQELYQTLGMLGVIYGFQQAISGVIGTYREFNAATTQASMIAEDYTGILERQAMAATQGMYGPQELTTVYRDLGAAGLAANQVLAATPEVLDFATAAMIEQADAAQAVIAAASSFRIPFEQADKITDAFAEAMNRTTLGGRDLVYALASIGPVAGMAEQSLGQTIAAVAALRNAGAHAQDAATSVRAAMLHLANPTDEARDAMKALGIQVYDAQGQMRQWADIVAEFERALQPYNQETRNMALTAMLGSDGIRAMAASMQMGSGQLRNLAAEFENADGTARRMAGAMEETLDGSIRRLTGNVQRATIVIGDDLSGALQSATGFLNTLAVGFANLDETTRKLIEVLIGTVGLASAIMSVVGMAKMLFTALNALGPVIATVGAGAKALEITMGGMAGIVGAVVVALGLGVAAWVSYQKGQEQAALAGADQARTLLDQRDRLQDLRDELQQLQSVTNPTNEQQNRLKQLAGEIATIAPEAASGIDLMTGKVEDLGKVLAGTNTAMARMMQQSQILAQGAVTVAQHRLPDLRGQKSDLDSKIAQWTEALQTGGNTLRGMGGQDLGLTWQQVAYLSEAEIRQRGTVRLSQLIEQATALQAEIDQMQSTLDTAAMLAKGMTGPPIVDDPGEIAAEKAWKKEHPGGLPKPGGKDGTGLFGGGGGDTPTWISQWKAGFEILTSAAGPYESALAGVSGELDILNAKQAYYLELLADGKGGVEAVLGAENARAQIVEKLRSQQEALHSANEAYRDLLPKLQAEQARLDGQYASGAISAKDYADASGAVQKELTQLNSVISQNSAAWWMAEQSIASAQAAAGEAAKALDDAQQRLRDKAFADATGALRHQKVMVNLSPDQQIAVLRQMLSEMTLTTEQAGSIQEQLVGLFGEKMRTEMDRIQDAYQDAMDAISSDLESKLDDIDRRLKETIGPLKEQLADLEEKARSTDRTRAEAEHNRQIADLQKERRYHSLRLGREHRDAVKRIDDQIAEENRQWTEQQDDWALDDQKRAIQEKIDTAEEGAKEEREQAQDSAKQQRKDLEKHYKEVKKITESGVLETIAALAATNPEWFSTGEGLIDNLIRGLETGDFSGVLAQINSVKAAADAAAEAAQRAVNTAINTSSSAAGVSTDPLEQVQTLARAGQYMQAALLLSQIGPMSLDQAKKNIEDWLGQDIPGFARGAWEIPYDDMAARLHKGETVLPSYAAKAFRTFAPSISNLDQVIMDAVGRVIAAIRDRPAGPIKVYGAENAVIRDQVDIDMLGRGLSRQVRLTLNGG